ncbi:hypothetical protein OG230_20780 [Streptomyces sp. NBC_00234]|uniref:hypothetical protein n=1 Tax=Streptomyces sp. NBC_00234 TaxID=2903638 RepID=UPI002E2DF0FF|nr:hypothetical protein [Streptomyces sp. NBC_00234]
MIRNVLGSVLALAGAAAAVLSPFRVWYEGRLGHDYRIQDLFEGITATESAVLGSILLPFLFAALLTLVGVVFRSRFAVAFAGVLVLGFTVLWMVRLGQAANGLTVGADGTGLQMGVAIAGAGGLLMLMGAALMSGRQGARLRRAERTAPYPPPGSDHPDTWPPTQEPGPSAQTSPWPEREMDPYVGPDPGPREDQETRSYPVQDEPPDHRRPPPQY